MLFRSPLAFAVTAVSGPQYYATLQSGQIFGLIGGLKGAAEYEMLLLDEYQRLNVTARAIQGMNVQTIVHILIILLTIVGNLAFFMKKLWNASEVILPESSSRFFWLM